MLDPDDIAAAVCDPGFGASVREGPLAGQAVLVTAGPTREPIDPVRYITNRSSGKMGYAIAAAAHALGARVTLISGPVVLGEPRGVEMLRVETAADMYAATHERVADADIFIAAAAVSDYRPADRAEQKIKKTNDTMSIDLIRSPDILASVAALDDAPFTVGFAAETENVRDYALGKLVNKKLDMIIANRVGSDCGFDYDDNAAEALWDGGERRFPQMPKTELAHELVTLIAERFALTRGADTQPALSIVSLKDQ
jgi:phosphopantothenoylcysteine decarboxylase/phosphopantothenate--cysteine ligase